MSVQITEAFVQQYGRNVQLLSQQKGSRLRECVRVEGDVVGKTAFLDQIGTTEARQRTTRHADTPLMNTPHARRMLAMVDYDWADLVDTEDKIKMLNDPTSSYAQSAAAAMARAMDSAIIAAANGTAATGETGSGTASLAAGNKIAAGATGLTIAKLITASTKFAGYEVDQDIPRFIAVAAKQLSDLLNTTQITSSDYNTVKALVKGEIDTFLGFKFKQTERLGLVGADRAVLAWAKDGIALGIGRDITSKISERADKGYATQVYYAMSIGAVRMEENKVVEIACVEA